VLPYARFRSCIVRELIIPISPSCLILKPTLLSAVGPSLQSES
jgi:hypothetical protein